MRKQIFFGFIGILLVAGFTYLRSVFPIISGYGAKNLCSHVFVSGRDAHDVLNKELGNFPLSLGSFKIDVEDMSASATVWGMAKKKAIFRPGLGCTLINAVAEEDLRAESFTPPAFPYAKDTMVWPVGDVLVDSLINPKVQTAIAKSFEEPDPKSPRYTRGVVVVHKGNLVAERYAEGYNNQTPQLSLVHGQELY